tara:strand:+ start:2059 stop:2244 length:186 start_codon:yes stop_codon:yes gene_type:complete
MTLRQNIKKADTQTLIKLVNIIKTKKRLAPHDDTKLTLAAEEIHHRNEQKQIIHTNHQASP